MRASEILYGVALEGQPVKLSDLEGIDLTVKAVGITESELGERVTVVCERAGVVMWFSTQSAVLATAFGLLKGNEPYQATFKRVMGKAGRQYWTVE